MKKITTKNYWITPTTVGNYIFTPYVPTERDKYFLYAQHRLKLGKNRVDFPDAAQDFINKVKNFDPYLYTD